MNLDKAKSHLFQNQPAALLFHLVIDEKSKEISVFILRGKLKIR